MSLALVGCSNLGNSNFSAQDLMFSEMMIPHHEQAIEMSDLALANSQDSDVLALATQIKNAQAPEIEQMKSWGGSHMGSHMESHEGHMMDGMLTDAEMRTLSSTEGKDFDRLFLEGMIKHHEGAIDMAEMAIDSKNQEVSSLANAIITAQRAEIERMRELLSR
jgi:uncharacterized protein (DUF305 family)